jgi:hypothetical protein
MPEGVLIAHATTNSTTTQTNTCAANACGPDRSLRFYTALWTADEFFGAM